MTKIGVGALCSFSATRCTGPNLPGHVLGPESTCRFFLSESFSSMFLFAPRNYDAREQALLRTDTAIINEMSLSGWTSQGTHPVSFCSCITLVRFRSA